MLKFVIIATNNKIFVTNRVFIFQLSQNVLFRSLWVHFLLLPANCKNLLKIKHCLQLNISTIYFSNVLIFRVSGLWISSGKWGNHLINIVALGTIT